MTPAEFHFISRITDVAKDLTIWSAAANATVATIKSAEVTELTPMFWIQLGLIPLPPIIACYLFTKVADYIGRCITKLRQPQVELRPVLRPVSQATSHLNGLTTDRIDEETRSVQRAHEIDENHDSTSEVTKVERFRRQIEQNEPSIPVVVSGNDDTHGTGQGTTLTRNSRPVGDAKRGIGIRRRVGPGSQRPKRDGWWFDARWD